MREIARVTANLAIFFLRVGVLEWNPVRGRTTSKNALPGFVFWRGAAYIGVWKLLCRYQILAEHTSGRKPTF
jgi:hypothetical protein